MCDCAVIMAELFKIVYSYVTTRKTALTTAKMGVIINADGEMR